MEIIRPSEHQLILKTSGNLRKIMREFVAIAPFWIVVIFVFVLISRIVFPVPPDLSTSILVGLFPYIGVGCIAIATNRDHTAIFDLDLQCVRIECYWVLFKKRQCQHYDLIDIENIIVAEDSEVDWFYIRLRQHSGEDIYVSHSGDRSMTEVKAQEIRDFLGANINLIEYKKVPM
jgi:hypothetical protein